MLFNYISFSSHFSGEGNWLQGKDDGSSWYHLCQLDLGSAGDFRALELLPEGWHDVDFRALPSTVPIGVFLVCPLAASFCRQVMGLLASVLPGNWFCEGVEVV